MYTKLKGLERRQMSKKYNDPKSNTSGRSVEVNGDFNKALRIFSKKIQDSGMLRELKDRGAHEPAGIANTRMKRAARKRWEKKVEGMIAAGQWHQDKPY